MLRNGGFMMKVVYDEALFDTIPGLCIGILAIRAVDNRGLNLDAEAFRRRCCTEANLLLKMNPSIAEPDIDRYKKALAHVGDEGTSALEKVIREYKKDLGIVEEEEAKEEGKYEILSAPKAANLDELAGSDALPRINPVMDIVRSGMLKFHVDIHAYDMGDRKTPLSIRKENGEWVVALGDGISTHHWFCEDGDTALINEDSENILILITGFGASRKKVAAARNELARRMKTAFDRSVETGWIEVKPYEFIATI